MAAFSKSRVTQAKPAAFSFSPDARARWMNELSKEQRNFSVDFSRHYFEQLVRRMSKKKSITFQHETLDTVIKRRCPCDEPLGQWFSDEHKLDLEHYPMQYQCSDARNLYQNLRHETKQRHQMATGELQDESKKLLAYSKQCFESTLEKIGKMSLPRSGVTAMLPDELPMSSGMALCGCPSQGKLKVNGRQGPNNVDQTSAVGVLGHLRTTCKYQPRICRHIHKVSQEYRVVCTAEPEVCQAQWKKGNVSAEGPFLLVPVHGPQNADSKLEDQVSATASPGSHDHLPGVRDDISTSFLRIHSHSSTKAKETEDQEPLSRESETRCWVDDATVSSVDDQKTATVVWAEADEHDVADMSADGGDIDVSLSLPPRKSTHRNVSLPMGPSISKSSRLSSNLSILDKKRISRYTPKMSATAEAEPETVVEPEVESQDEFVSEQEEEGVPPQPPSMLCPSSAAKSHNSEIKMWLKKTSFSAASKTLPLFS